MSLRERVYSILIVSSTDSFTSAFADLLPETRYSPVHTVSSVSAAKRVLAEKAFEGMFDKETILKWLKTFYRRFFTQQFKRSCQPDGIKVGSVGISPRGDLKMPSDASFSLWLEEAENL